MQRVLRDYVKTIREEGQGRSRPLIYAPERPDLAIELEQGYPVMPPIPIGIEQTKPDLEELIRRYLTIHYSKYSISK